MCSVYIYTVRERDWLPELFMGVYHHNLLEAYMAIVSRGTKNETTKSIRLSPERERKKKERQQQQQQQP